MACPRRQIIIVPTCSFNCQLKFPPQVRNQKLVSRNVPIEMSPSRGGEESERQGHDVKMLPTKLRMLTRVVVIGIEQKPVVQVATPPNCLSGLFVRQSKQVGWMR